MKRRNFLICLCSVLCFMTISTSCTKTGSINTSNNSQISKEDSNELRLVSPNNEIKKISKENVMEIKQGMTYVEIIKKLGATKDVGSGLFVAQYIVDEKLSLTLSFANLNDKCPLNGEQLLDKAKSI